MRRTWSLVVFAAAVGTGLALSVKPWQVYHTQRKKADEAQIKAERAQAERAELTRQKALLDSPLGKEKLARERGYVRPDEQPLDKP